MSISLKDLAQHIQHAYEVMDAAHHKVYGFWCGTESEELTGVGALELAEAALRAGGDCDVAATLDYLDFDIDLSEEERNELKRLLTEGEL